MAQPERGGLVESKGTPHCGITAHVEGQAQLEEMEDKATSMRGRGTKEVTLAVYQGE